MDNTLCTATLYLLSLIWEKLSRRLDWHPVDRPGESGWLPYGYPLKVMSISINFDALSFSNSV